MRNSTCSFSIFCITSYHYFSFSILSFIKSMKFLSLELCSILSFYKFIKSLSSGLCSIGITLSSVVLSIVAALDSPVTYNETREVICQMKADKADKAPDLNGIPPGIMKLLPVEFIVVIISVFNLKLFSWYMPKLELSKVRLPVVYCLFCILIVWLKW